MTDQLKELIGQLEKATRPDTNLGRRVLLAAGWSKTCVGHFYGPLYYWSGPNGEHYDEDRLPCPMRSIDMALSIVPKGNWWEVKQRCAKDSPMRSFGSYSGMFAAQTHDDWGAKGYRGDHDNAAIALCIAALKYRAAQTVPETAEGNRP